MQLFQLGHRSAVRCLFVSGFFWFCSGVLAQPETRIVPPVSAPVGSVPVVSGPVVSGSSTGALPSKVAGPESVSPATLVDSRDPIVQASAALMLWRRDWENRDFERFAAHHADNFQVGQVDRATFLERKRAIFEKRPWHRIRVTEVLWLAEQGTPDALTARFVQEYESPQGADRIRKEQRWRRAKTGGWRLELEREELLAESIEVGAGRKTQAKTGSNPRY